jgi:hypothetical protein
MSGGTLKDLARFGQGLAADDYNDQFNRFMAIAGGGQQAATAGAQLGQQSAQNIGSLLTQQGNARASGYIGQANAINGGLQGLASLLPYALGGGGGGFGNVATMPMSVGVSQGSLFQPTSWSSAMAGLPGGSF